MKWAWILLFFPALVWAKPTCTALLWDMKQVRWVPYVSDGHLQGYVIHDLKKESSLAQLGLRDLDLVTEIDGVKVTDEKAIRKAIDGICAAKPSAQFNLLRSGKPLALEIELVRHPR